MANITIDGKPYVVKDGVTLIEAIDEARIPLPRYCYHPGLSIAGNCRICQVEVEKTPRTVIACNTRVADGMVIHTRSPKAKESQRVVLEFLLANHPLDCPVCDQAGECKLQDYYMEVGLYDPKFDEMKVKKTKKAFPIGPTVMLDQERCILCSRCVRFTDEITKTHEFGIFNRGDHSEVDVTPGKQLDNKYSGNVVDICPVGALTDRDFRFKVRVWYLKSQKSVCPACSRGCNMEIHYEASRPYHLQNERIMRLKPRENHEVNQWWLCDEGRYAYRPIDFNRLKKWKMPAHGGQEEADWEKVLEKLAFLLKGTGTRTNGRWALIASPQAANEEIYLQKLLFKDYLKWADIGFKAPGQEGYEDDFLIKRDKNPNSTGALEIFGLSEAASDITAIVEKAKKGEFAGIWVRDHDLAKVFGEETLRIVRQRLQVLVYEGTNGNPTADCADFVLAGAAYAEKEGSFTNFQGRVQRIWKAVEPLGDSKPAWQILTRLAGFLGLLWNYTKPESIFNDLARETPAFRDLSYKKIGDQGVVWRKSSASLRGA
ncbi:MAG: (2Fe-2S)-binding protein [Candidatus Omnitrophica bacterium]|nr:(2Fe-2S)-binding protein [Candidatus Omnitrophota bacterium]